MKNKNKRFLAIAIILIILKQILINYIPIHVPRNSDCDDGLMIKIASNLLRFNWLGEYNQLTHVKGIFFPFFLAINTFLGISYIDAVTLLYSISCLIFTLSIKKIFKTDWSIYIIFIILLFNPIMYSFGTVQRVYRNSLIPSEVLLILSSFFYMFLNQKENKKICLFSIIGGISLASFYNTREDAIWLMPFVFIFTFILIINDFLINNKKIYLKKIFIFLLPLFILLISNLSISLINYKYYGIFVRVDESKTPFSEAIKTIYSVPTKENIRYVSVTKEKINRLYKISPSLNSISKEIDTYSKIFDNADRNPNDGEVEDGWFWWVLRFAVNEKGYYKDAKTANIFYKNIAKEIETAQKSGKIEKQNTMPSALMSPWRKGYLNQLTKAFIKTIKFTVSYEDVEAKIIPSNSDLHTIGIFEITTNNKAIYPYLTILDGSYNHKNVEYIKFLSDDEVIKEIKCINEICDIDFETNKEIDYRNLLLIAYDKQNNEIENNKLFNLINEYASETNTFNKINNDYLKLKFYSNYDVINNQKKVSSFYVKKLNIISKIYKKFGFIIAIISFLIYILITYNLLVKKEKLINEWIILSSILCSYVILCLGVSYNHISSCDSITSLYLSGSYPLIIIFSILTIIIFIEIRKNK